MANKFIPSIITSAYNAVTALNNNFANLATLLDNCLSRDGSSPNTMGADLDMNSHSIHNVIPAVSDTDVPTYKQVRDTLIKSGALGNMPSALGQFFTVGGIPILSHNKYTINNNQVIRLCSAHSAVLLLHAAQLGGALLFYEVAQTPVLLANVGGIWSLSSSTGGQILLRETATSDGIEATITAAGPMSFYVTQLIGKSVPEA